ncbi:hypothetical protein ACH9EU_03070 [Kocuria sp. M1R5S2]|uniref:hypothetical protein n=1 Tax=Kocuria rhizosphaerae TaxID=3376285 RepID=UPI00378C74EF
MDSLGTWPRPLPPDERDFDAQVVRRLRAGEDDADRPPPRERAGAWLLLVIPLLAAVAVVLLWQQWSRSGSTWFLVLVAGVLVGAALWWAGRLRRTLGSVRALLGRRLADVVDHGVGVVQELTLEPAGDEADADSAGRVRARLDLSVNPVRGSRFRTVVEAVYESDAALLLEVGSHGPVRFLRHDPEGTTVVDTRLSEEQVRQVYRAVALN